ncbi:hypothetical protein BCR44DRAFT_1426711 [Catenaria anguillulae PL171]|uniref:Uncharacterized protein n=1 Tax=Catenaria anguillulae PL171 TaxID=765915 RepID=A0A1Y2HY26_9FUNG|nr:hypothetical protein BCR44DRAFT_1426711 [Catenaria anguillulae PL171]
MVAAAAAASTSFTAPPVAATLNSHIPMPPGGLGSSEGHGQMNVALAPVGEADNAKQHAGLGGTQGALPQVARRRRSRSFPTLAPPQASANIGPDSQVQVLNALTPCSSLASLLPLQLPYAPDSSLMTTTSANVSNSSVTPPKLKRQRTRKTYSFTEKAQALDQLAAIRATDPTISVERAARQVRINGLPIPDSTLHSWIADEAAIRTAASQSSKSTEAIAQWAKQEVEATAAATKPAGPAHPAACPGLKIQQCARTVARKKAEKLKRLGRPVPALLEAFCGSDGWLDRFKTRWGIKLNGAGAAAAASGRAAAATTSAANAGTLADVCGGNGSVWTEEKWDVVIDRIIAIECGTATAASASLATADADSAAMEIGGDTAQVVPPVACVMPPSALPLLSSASATADSNSADEDALSFLLNYSGPESSSNVADVCDCGTVSAAAAAASSISPNGASVAVFSGRPMPSLSWFTANGADGGLPQSVASGSSSTMTPIPLQQLLSMPLVPNEHVATSAASTFLSFHELPQEQQQQQNQQQQQPASYASSSPSYSPPTSPAYALGPHLHSSPPASPSSAYSAVNTFHDLHAHFVGTREWDVSVLAAAKEILVRNGEWVNGGEDAVLQGACAVRGV